MQQQGFEFEETAKNLAEEALVTNDNEQVPVGLGRRLFYLRKALNISSEDIADTLRVSHAVIKAIEADDYQMFTSPVFLRGYIRAYAKLVHLPDCEVDSELIRLKLKEPTVSIEKHTKFNIQQVSPKDKPVRVTTYLVTVGFVFLIVMWLYSHHEDEKMATQLNVTQANSVQSPAPLGPAISNAESLTPTIPVNGDLGNAVLPGQETKATNEASTRIAKEDSHHG